MKIGVDIDGVLTNLQDYVFEYGAKFALKKGNSISNLKKDEYDPANIFNWPKRTAYEFLMTIKYGYFKNEKPRPFASEILQKLNEDHKIYIITARKFGELDKRTEITTENWLKEHNIPYDEIYYSGTDKREIVKKLKVDIMIEDSPDNIKELSEITEIIIFDAKYNQKCLGHVRVNSWHEIYYHINKRKNNE